MKEEHIEINNHGGTTPEQLAKLEENKVREIVCAPLYPPRTKVWMMEQNKPRQVIVFMASVKPMYGAMGRDRWIYKVWYGDSLHGVTEKACTERHEEDLFPTKEKLIASL